MATRLIAGHSFDTLTDRCVGTVVEDGEIRICGKRWLDIHHVDRTYVDEKGYAHNGTLAAYEVDQVVKERERRASVFEAAINGRSSGAVDDADIDSAAEPVQWAEG